MTNTLLRSIRTSALDESEPLAGLLRKCLMLGAETRSDSLRNWARSELNGYGEGMEVPEYRKIWGVPLSVDSVSGYNLVRGQVVNQNQVPKEARKFLVDYIHLRQPIEELEDFARGKQTKFASQGLSFAQAAWNETLSFGRDIMGMSYILSGSIFAGILGQIRTQLVDIIAELTADTPLEELPQKEKVDAAMAGRIGNIYNTTISAADGPVAIGDGAKAHAEGLGVSEVLRLLKGIREAASGAPGANAKDLLEAIDDLQEVVDQQDPETGEVVKKAGKLREAAAKLGIEGITTAVGTAVKSVTELAVNGAFA